MPAATAATGSQSFIGSPSAVTVACEDAPTMRSVISCSKPFMTEVTVISAVTPRKIPTIEISEMKEMKWFRRLARV